MTAIDIKQKIVTLNVSSIDELKKSLEEVRQANPRLCAYVNLSLSDPDLLVRTFQFDDINPKEDIRSKIIYDAIELLTLPAEEIFYDYQIYSRSPKTLMGIYVCLPKKKVLQYLSVIRKYNFVPHIITAHILTSLNHFFAQCNPEDRFAYINFINERHIYLGVFSDHRSELIRIMAYESQADAQKQIIQSLRSANGNSQVKEIKTIWVEQIDVRYKPVFENLGSLFNAEVRPIAVHDEDRLASDKDLFHLNLVKHFSVSISVRKRFFNLLKILTVCYAIFLLGLDFTALMNIKKVRALRSSFSQSDYEQAKELKSLLEQ